MLIKIKLDYTMFCKCPGKEVFIVHKKDPITCITFTEILGLVTDVPIKYQKAAISFCSLGEVELITFCTCHPGSDMDLSSALQ